MMPQPPSPPQDFSGLVGLLESRGPALPKRLKQVAEHALAHPDDMAFNSAAEIARHAGVQPSTLVRFAQALDFSGFSDLQRVFRARLRQLVPDYRARLSALREGAGEGQREEMESGAGVARAMLDGFIRAGHASLDQLQAGADPEAITRAATRLAAAETIIILGARRMFPVASYLAYAFAKLGLRAILLDHVGGMGGEQAALARPGDALIAISAAPYTPQTVEFAAEAHQRGVDVIALTDSPLSPLVPHCAQWLEIAEADFGAFRSMAATFALAMTLAVVTAERTRTDA